MFIRSLIYFAALVIPAQHDTVYPFASGQHIEMDLSAGEYIIKGSPDEKVHIQWSSTDPKEADKLDVRFKTDHGKTLLTTLHTKEAKFVIEVPARTDLYVRLTAGELTISGIQGHKDIGLTAGDLRVDVGDPEQYSEVDSSVRIGDINASAFDKEKSGFLKKLHLTGRGKYSLRATVGVGDVRLMR